MTKLFTRPTSHYILIIIFAVILFSGLYYSVKITYLIKGMSTLVSTNMAKTMDPKVPDPGKTKSETSKIPFNSKKVYIGTYLERVENLDIKESSWTYEFYLWFKWKSNEVDFLGDKVNKILPFTIVNGDILKCDLVER